MPIGAAKISAENLYAFWKRRSVLACTAQGHNLHPPALRQFSRHFADESGDAGEPADQHASVK
jgi:hypothetical protein